MDFISKYKENLNKDTDQVFIQYEDSLKLFYNPDALCPSCNKKGLIRSKEESLIKMKCDKCGWKLRVVLPKYINIYKELIMNNNKKANIITDIIMSNMKEKKAEYKVVKETIKNLDDILSVVKNDKEKFEKEKIELLTEMMKIYIDRQKYFNSIKDIHLITKDIRNKFIEIIKDEKTISDKRLNEIVKNLAGKVDKADAENYFRWLVISNQYIQVSEKLNKLNKTSKDEVRKITVLPINFMIEPPKVNESTTKEKINNEEVEKKQELKTIRISKNKLPKDEISDENTQPPPTKNITITPEQLIPAKPKKIRIRTKGGFRFVNANKEIEV